MSRREFQFREGTSQKFWAITLDGAAQTVQFGKIGTAGQTQTKTFPSEQAARQATDKLIAEKVKKGYTEIMSGQPAAAATPATAPTTATTPKAAKPRRAAPAEPAAPAAPPPVPALVVTRTLPFEPDDWKEAAWTVDEPAEKPASVEKDKALRNLCKIDRSLEGESFNGKLSVQQARDLFVRRDRSRMDATSLLDLLRCFLEPMELVELCLAIDAQNPKWWADFEGVETIGWLASHALPNLAAKDQEQARRMVRAHLATPRTIVALHLAALLGLHDEVRAGLAALPEDQFRGTTNYGPHDSERLILTLPDGKDVAGFMRRFKLPLSSAAEIAAWLVRTGFDHLDYVRDQILAQTNKGHAEQLMQVLCRASAPEMAPIVLELKVSSKVSGLARKWLDDHPANAIAGLVPAAGGQGKLAEAARDYLREANRKGHTAFIEEQLRALSPETARRVRQEVLAQAEATLPPLDAASAPPWLTEALASQPAGPALPAWVVPENLPPLRFGEGRLSDDQIRAVLASLRQSKLGEPQPLVRALKENVPASLLEPFAWKLFELWLAEGAVSKEKWAFTALGLLGGDAAALKLTPLVRVWPGESQHQRAVTGLEVLRAIGSDTALTQLNGIAQKLKFQGLKNKAQEFMEAIARDKGLSRDELEDRIVPDLDLDARGTRLLDFGPRQFRVVLGPDLAPLVRDEAGKVKADLPKPGAKDDAEKASEAVAQWKLLKKQLREAVKVQAYRLEQAMVTGRRWPAESFERLLVRHPLMTNLVQRLLWAGFDAKAKRVLTFRVTEDQTCADAADRACALDKLATVGIVHPLHLGEPEQRAWGQVFGDYEIIPPFPQLGRPVHTLEPKEAKGTVIDRIKGKLPPLSVRGTLERLGWTRGSTSDHGVIMEFHKHFPGASVSALLNVEPGIPIGNPDWAEEQKIERVFFLADKYDPADYPWHQREHFVPLDTIDPVAISEVLADLNVLASKEP